MFYIALKSVSLIQHVKRERGRGETVWEIHKNGEEIWDIIVVSFAVLHANIMYWRGNDIWTGFQFMKEKESEKVF